MVKSSCSDMQKGVWNEDEDGKKISYVSKQHESGNWATFSKRSGKRRSGRRHRERWISNQKNDPKHKSFTPQEEEAVIMLHALLGSRWPAIPSRLPGRTENDVKILWDSKLSKRLSAVGIDSVTHEPFKILVDYGTMEAFPTATARFTSLSRDLSNEIILKSEQNYIITEFTTQNFITECASSLEAPFVNQEILSFGWCDFSLEDAFSLSDVLHVQENVVVVQCDENGEGKTSYEAVEDKNGGGGGVFANYYSFEASSSSNSSSFVEAMIWSPDEMFSQLPCSYEEPIYHYK